MTNKTVLGLDIGSNSIGWALVNIGSEGQPEGIMDMGVRIFDAGIQEDTPTGTAGPKNRERREARLRRRLYDRRRRRKRKLLNVLKRSNLFPETDEIAESIKKMDEQTYFRYKNEVEDARKLAHSIPYFLRARALDHKLDRFELGRAIYHLGQRRGFLSNRKAQAKEDEGVVKAAISTLRREIEESGSRTLGEYLSKLDPEEQRLRARYTHRQMFIDEFNEIWQAQRGFGHSELTDSLKKEMEKAIFFQRKLKSAKHLIGSCALEPEEKRCPWYRFEAQRFRVLQNVNNLRLIDQDGVERQLTESERTKLIELLEEKDKVTFTEAKKALGLKPRSCRFSIESGGEKQMRGNRTNAALKSVFGKRWDSLAGEQKEKILLDLHSFKKEWALAKRARKVWELNEEEAEKFSKIRLEEGYCNLSLKAIRKITPLLEAGKAYAEAAKEVYGSFKLDKPVVESLPPVDGEIDDLRNPVVHRCLTELRHCLNPILKRYGKPDSIHVELARDVKSSRQEKKRRTDKMRDNERARQAAAAKILQKTGISDPSRNDVLKVLLAEECNWTCPYTQKSIDWAGLFGSSPEYDIEHIVPFSVSLDDSFINKTLCFHQENVHIKKNRTPYEAYGNDKEKYEAIIQSVKRFRGSARGEKLRRFLLTDTSEFENFSARHLNDTRYASKETVNFLSLLYGGISDESGKLKIQTVKGQITALLRNYLGLNSIFGEGGKTRNDHRHHAIDALVVAITSPLAIKRLSTYAGRYGHLGRIPFGEESTLGEEVMQQVRDKIDGITPVHRYSKKVRGALHEETLYGLGADKGTANIRRPLENMKQSEVDKIADNTIQRLVRDKLAELGESDPQKAFKKPENRPVITTREGRERKINSARIKTKLATFPIGAGDKQRYVKGGSNHHIEIVALLDDSGNETEWEGHVVSLFEAYQRKKNKQPVVQRDFGAGKKFKFSLAWGELVEMEIEKGKREIFVLRSVYQQMAFARATDARMKKDIMAAGDWVTKYPNTLRAAKCRKVFLTPFGEVRYAND